MEISLKNRVILVTGAGGGIGRAISASLLNCGARVACHYRRSRKSLESLRGIESDSLFQADLQRVENTTAMFQAVISRFGKLDILVNNAATAIYSPLNKERDQWIGDWKTTLDINLTAPALLCRLAVETFLKQKSPGRIINIASRAAFRGDTADYLAYAASKGGMVALTRSIARAFAGNEITAYTVAPGFVQTPMAQDFFERYGREACVGDIDLPRLPTPEDIAPTVAFLCSSQSTHATGCTVDINSATYVH